MASFNGGDGSGMYGHNSMGHGYYDGSGYYEGANDANPEQAYYAGASAPQGQYSQQAYGTEGMDPQYYPQHQGYGGYSQPENAGFGNSYRTSAPKSGSFYFHGEVSPQIHGFPVNSLAFDNSYQAMYIGSVTQSMSSTRWRSHRASMLVTHNTVDGMLYSAVAGHPEASPSTLQAVYGCMFGISKTIPVVPGRQRIPPHAYQAPYGSSDVDSSVAVMGAGKKHGHIGITTILPLGGYTATISPSAVRIHGHGGLQIHDQNLEGMISGTIHPHSDQGGPTHISVGGLPCNPAAKHRAHEVHCMDLWQGLRIVSSRSFKDRLENSVGVTAMATSHDLGNIVAGCSDGTIRILDGSLREVATVKSHKGGVSSMAVSPDGMFIATTGYSSRVDGKDSSILYSFPDPTVYIYDIRRLGRAGIPHPFAGLRRSPQFVSFIPDVKGFASNRFIVASGQPGGGLQTMVPFEAQDEKSTNFLHPQLNQGESISAMTQSDDELALGTSNGRVLRYKLAGYSSKSMPAVSTSHRPYKASPPLSSATQKSKAKKKKELALPSFVPPVPPLSLDPKLLLSGNDPGRRNGSNEKTRAVGSVYMLRKDPKLSVIGNSTEDATAHFGNLGGSKIVYSARRIIADRFLSEGVQAEGDFILTVPTSKLDVDLLSDHNPISKRYKGKKTREPKPNPNKLIYNPKMASICYEDGGKRRFKSHRPRGGSGDETIELPKRYRLQTRPNFKSSGAFDPCHHNDSGLFPGWDYAPTMPNAFAPPVLLLLYFIPEIRAAVLSAQIDDKTLSSKSYEKALSPELGFIFHQIESLSKYGLLHPLKAGSSPLSPRVGAWMPSHFLTALSTMPEAEQLQILDGSPAAVDPPRRPEAFYRFLAYQLDKEQSKNTETKLMDSLLGIDFLSSNQFITGSSPPSQSTTRAMTLELSYDAFLKENHKKTVHFGDLLQHSLCRETRLRAWNSKSKAYETIVQRKIVTSLPEILTLSCACAGRKNEEGLTLWRTDDGGPWLPEMLQVELLEDGHVAVAEMKTDEAGNKSWTNITGRSKLPRAVSKLVSSASTKGKVHYRLEAVLSFVIDGFEESSEDEHSGHHVLHARVSRDYKNRALKKQQEAAKQVAAQEPDPTRLVLSAGVTADICNKRIEKSMERLSNSGDEEDGWVLYNGFAVSSTVGEDARAFHVSFKEPCLVVYREVGPRKNEIVEDSKLYPQIPVQVMNARSLSSNTSKIVRNFAADSIHSDKLIAFDAEFVSVQEEETTLAESGSKVVLQETRYALGRISIIDCDTRGVIIDDHVLPRERVVDYLTRFSGIVADDLDPTKTTHNLISARNAYLKLRYLMEQGCIFVGHGLRQDFATVNLQVPPNQILDTVEIYHQPGMRYISLRYLANHVLGRDMQQDVHDSVEDALAAFELYEIALRWKQEEVFDQKLQEIYSHGQKTDWKLGVQSK